MLPFQSHVDVAFASEALQEIENKQAGPLSHDATIPGERQAVSGLLAWDVGLLVKAPTEFSHGGLRIRSVALLAVGRQPNPQARQESSSRLRSLREARKVPRRQSGCAVARDS